MTAAAAATGKKAWAWVLRSEAHVACYGLRALASVQQPALYDDPEFFSSYQKLRILDGRLNDVVERPALLSLMPIVDGLAVADLGCGTGAMCRWLAESGAGPIVGYDPSSKMLEQARAQSVGYDIITYEQTAIEQLQLRPSSLGLVISGLALHYVDEFTAVVSAVARALLPGGCFLFSVEHPVLTCSSRRWHLGEGDTRLHWPIDNYLDEGARTVSWMGLDNVPRQHRTVSTYVNALIDAGLTIHRLLEPGLDSAAITNHPRLIDQRRRPPFLVIRANKLDR